MARYSITPDRTFGVRIPHLHGLAREAGADHDLAVRLWAYDSRETRILASMVEIPALATEEQLDAWVREFDTWETCDQCCMNLIEKTPFAWSKAVEWSGSASEFSKRAGFVLMARLAVSDRHAQDHQFVELLPIIQREATDSRNFVKKAANWALRQIGKRNLNLNRHALEAARAIGEIEDRSARWIARDAVRELTSDAVQARLTGRAPA
jgi:3-methyladenine DNA glycosylase AlkD